MNKKQRDILINFAVVIAITVGAVIGMIEMKNRINRSEAFRAMEQLGRVVSDYKQKNGFLPSESYIDSLKQTLEGQVRLGVVHYRAQWITIDSPKDEIVAYVIKDYHSLFTSPGAIVVRLDGRVEWMDKNEFDKLPVRQQSIINMELAPK